MNLMTFQIVFEGGVGLVPLQCPPTRRPPPPRTGSAHQQLT